MSLPIDHDWVSGDIKTTLSPAAPVSKRSMPGGRTPGPTSDEQHLRLLADRLDFLILRLVIDHVDRLLDVAEHEVAVAVICLGTAGSARFHQEEMGPRGGAVADAYVESPLELAVAPELDEDDLVEQEADQVEGLRDVGGLVSGVGHDGRWH